MQQSEAIRHLAETDWAAGFDPEVVSLAVSQGKDWRLGTVSWRPTENGGAFRAGLFYRNSYSSFTATILLTADGEAVNLATNCSCGGRLCEHGYLATAAILKAERSKAAFDPSPIASWVQSVLRSAQPQSAAETARLAVVVGTLLERRQLAGDDLLVTPMMATDTATLELSRPSIVHIADDDERRLAALSTTAYEPVPRHEPGTFFVRTKAQEDVILDLLSKGLAFYGKGSTVPLIAGPAIIPTFAWQIGELGMQNLAVCDKYGAPFDIVALGHSGWYIDTANQTMGRLRCDIEQLRAMRAAPTIRKEHSAAVIAVWDKLANGINVRKPVDLNTIQTSVTKAKPVLTTRIGSVRFADGTERPVPIANVVYDYDGVLLTDDEFDSHGVASRVIRGVVTQFTRDSAAHDFARAALTEAGLVGSNAAAERGELAANSGLGPGDQVYADAPESRAAFWNGLNLLADKGIPHFGRDIIKPKKLGAAHQFGRLIPTDSSGRWFDIELGVEVDGVKHSLEPILLALLADPLFKLRQVSKEPWAVTLPNGEIVTLPADLLHQMVTPLVDWLTRRRDDPSGDHRLSPTTAAIIGEGLGKAVDGRTLKWLRAAIRRLTDLDSEALEDPPKDLKAELRPYQRDGLRWLNALADTSMESQTGIGGVLADDMGLGKTLQCIAHLLWLRDKGYLFAPALIIVPKSLVGNWVSELEKFAPSLTRLVFEGKAGDRSARFLEMAGVNIVITTYQYLVRDLEGLREQPFSLVVTDEGQRVKNLRTKAAVAIRSLAGFRVLDLTGTAVENHLGELYAHVDMAVPSLLGSEKEFNRYYRVPIEKHGNKDRLSDLQRKIAPFILRRTKDQVATELPPKTEVVQYVEMGSEQAALYETVRLAVRADVQAAIAKQGIGKANIVILDALLKLRQVCCDPRLVKSTKTQVQDVPSSAKLDELFDVIDTAVAEGRRILIFSAFAQMLKLIGAEAEQRGIAYQSLTGETRDRDGEVKAFQQGNSPLFLLSLKAGGVGLNLTAADTVIHYDPWWNPAAEAQATDRAHRIGQDKPVFVYRLICKGTVEERIGQLQGRKAALAAAVYGDNATAATKLKFTQADVENLFG